MRITNTLAPALVLAVLGMVSATALAETILETSADAWGMKGYYNGDWNADVNYGGLTPYGYDLLVKWDGGIWSRKAWVKFDLSSITETMGSASLQAVKASASTTAQDLSLDVYALNDGDADEGWDEMTITYNNAPANLLAENAYDSERTTYVGSFTYNAKEDPVGTVLEFSSPELLAAVNGDTDGQLSLFFVQTPNSAYSLALAGREDEEYAGTTLILNPVPEPTTWCLMVTGLLILPWASGRRLHRRGALTGSLGTRVQATQTALD